MNLQDKNDIPQCPLQLDGAMCKVLINGMSAAVLWGVSGKCYQSKGSTAFPPPSFFWIGMRIGWLEFKQPYHTMRKKSHTENDTGARDKEPEIVEPLWKTVSFLHN